MHGINTEAKLVLSLFLILVLVALFVAFSFTKINPGSVPGFEVTDGNLDLSSCDFSAHSMIELKGEWVYRRCGEDPASGAERKTMRVPGYWNAEFQSGDGCATIECRVTLGPAAGLWMYLRNAFTAYELFINGELAAGNGIVGLEKSSSVPQRLPVFFGLPKSGELYLSLRISNFHDDKGGPGAVPVIGTRESILEKVWLQDFIDSVVLGILLLIFVYHLFLWIVRTKDRENLYFALFSFLMFIRLLATNDFLERLFPSLDVSGVVFEIRYKIEYLTMSLGCVSFTSFFYELFKKEYSRTFIKVFMAIGVAYSALVVIAPAKIYVFFVLHFSLFTIIGSMYTIYVLVRACVVKREGALIILAGFVIFFVTLLNDALYDERIVYTGYLAHFGITIFVLVQSSVLSYRYSQAMNKIEHLSINLKQDVENKTLELTEQKTRLEVANSRLREMDDYKTRLFQNITHELKTPLTLILDPLRTIINDDQTGEKTKRNVRTVFKNAEHLYTLINQILELTRIELGKATVLKEQVDIVKYVSFIAESFELHKVEKKVRFSVETGVESLVMSVDKEKFRIVLSNLLSNAFKFVDHGGAITVSLAVADGDANRALLEMRVRNTGSCIPDSEKEKIFDRFYQSKGCEQGGTGLGIGLSLVKEYVKMHDGSIRVESDGSLRTEFVVLLPIGTVEADSSAHDEKEGTVGKADTRPLVLVAEDNDELRAYIRDVLSERYSVREAIDGSDALMKAKERTPDLVISDLIMPVKDGFELIADMKKDDALKDVPVVFVTARSSPEIKMKGLDAGAIDYITKPFYTDELVAKIDSIIRNRELHTRKNMEVFENRISRLLRAGDNKDEVRIDYSAYGLSVNEAAIVEYLLKGREYKEIADALRVSESSVKKRISRIYKKCGVQNKIELARKLLGME